MDYSKLTYEDGMHDAYQNIYRRKMNVERAKKNRRKESLLLLKQRISAVIIILIACIVPYLTDRDASASVIIIVIAIWLLFTKEKVLFK